MISRISKVVLLFGAVLFGACIDLSAPTNAPASISLPQAQALFVVRNDVLRDTLGTPIAPIVTTFDGAGTPTGSTTASFFVTDSIPLLAVAQNGVLTAGSVLGTAHVVGQVGPLQTPATSFFITVAPTKLISTTPVDTTMSLVFGQDSSSDIATLPLSVSLRGAGDTVVAGGIVHYTILYQPLTSRSATSPVVYLSDDAGNRSVADTTDASGTASRKLTINSHFVADTALLAGNRTDSVIVQASLRYNGVLLTGTPAPRFVIRIKGGFGG